MAMERKKKSNILEEKVKPFYKEAKECYMKYSQDQILSNKTEILTLTPKQVKKSFKFNLLCDDLKKTARDSKECLEHTVKHLSYYGIEGITSYSVQKNTLDSFVVYKISPQIGYGVSSLVPIKKGTVIGEYVGERKVQDIFEKLFGDKTYMLLMDNNNIGPDIDAKHYGNIARFFSHCPMKSDNPEVLTANVQPIGCGDRNKGYTNTYFMAIRDIIPFPCFN